MHLLTVNSVVVEVKKDGERSEDKTEIVENLIVSPRILERLRSVLASF